MMTVRRFRENYPAVSFVLSHSHTAKEAEQGSGGEMAGGEGAEHDNAVKGVHAGHQRSVQKTGNVAENLVTHNESRGEDKDKNEGAQVSGLLKF